MDTLDVLFAGPASATPTTIMVLEVYYDVSATPLSSPPEQREEVATISAPFWLWPEETHLPFCYIVI
jgi:hypothetical protein